MKSEKYRNGMTIRREVLGDEYVDRAIARSTEFSAPLQELVAENAWGSVWARDGLDRKTRSLITLAMLTALKASTELKTHVRGALRNGCTAEEIQEVLLHASAYCGFPAAIEAFRSAGEVVDAWHQEGNE